MSEKKDVAMAVLWHGGDLIIEERWEDTEQGAQETYYAFPGGKIEDNETPTEAVVREVFEETGITLDPGYLKEPEKIPIDGRKVYIFQVLLQKSLKLGDESIIILTPYELMGYKDKGKLMPFTEQYVERNFISKNGVIDN
jgi:8-oxo-dGTP pyrophosphatase MutT (NUDIX family)